MSNWLEAWDKWSTSHNRENYGRCDAFRAGWAAAKASPSDGCAYPTPEEHQRLSDSMATKVANEMAKKLMQAQNECVQHPDGFCHKCGSWSECGCQTQNADAWATCKTPGCGGKFHLKDSPYGECPACRDQLHPQQVRARWDGSTSGDDAEYGGDDHG